MRTRSTPATRATAGPGRTRRPARTVTVQRRAAEHPTGEQRTRDAGGPQDHALYTCACGHAFEGDVSTHVACPKCGGDQTW